MDHRQMFFQGIDAARLVRREMCAQVMQRFARDLLNGQLARDAVLELMRHEVEIDVAIEHGRLFVEKRQHVFL